MKSGITTLVFTLFAMISFAQQPCSELSLGQFFKKLKDLKPIEQALTYKNVHDFSFETFTPIETSGGLMPITLGYDSDGKIREVRFGKNDNRYSLIVYDFDTYRILLLKLDRGSERYRYTPTAIYNSKKSDRNYMINVKAQFKNDYESFTLFDQFPIGRFEDISCLMKLDKELYPHEMIKFSNSKIVSYSNFKYEFERSHKVTLELIHFYIDVEKDHPKLKINKNSCMGEISDRGPELLTESNLVIFAKPSIFGDTTEPVWVFSGAHRYDLVEK